MIFVFNLAFKGIRLASHYFLKEDFGCVVNTVMMVKLAGPADLIYCHCTALNQRLLENLRLWGIYMLRDPVLGFYSVWDADSEGQG